MNSTHLVNFDGATFKELGCVGLGVVVRDSFCCVIGALVEKIHLPNATTMVKALACRRAMVFAKELCVFDCVFEGEAIVKAIQSEEASRVWLGAERCFSPCCRFLCVQFFSCKTIRQLSCPFSC